MSLPRVLVYKSSYARVGAEMTGADCVVMDEAGAITLNGETLTPETAALDAAWINFDVFGSPASRAFFGAIMTSPTIRWAHTAAAGLDHPMFAKLVEKGVTLSTTHVQSLGIAEFVIWGVLDALQRGPEQRKRQAERRWDRLRNREVAQTTWLIVGFGAIGQDVAKRARAFGARIVGVRRSAGSHPLADTMISDWRQGLADADVIVLSLPLSPATKNMADASAFAAMKPGSILVNVARGGLVNEPDLLAALDQGRPQHAVLDVFVQEPLPADSPFWTHPNVMLSPHDSPSTEGYARRADEWFLGNLQLFLAGKPVRDVVKAAEVIAGVTPNPAAHRLIPEATRTK